jgi:ribosomal protein S18 acetylase RimI-like enzyme
MIIKRINAEFIKSLYNLGKEEFGGEFWFTKRFIEDTLKRRGLYYGAFENKKLIGAILVDTGIDKPKAWIFFFDVLKKYRNCGVGSKLLSKIEKSLPKDYYKLFVDFEKGDQLAIKFYKKHGFKKAGKIKDWFGLGTKGLIYSKTVKK